MIWGRLINLFLSSSILFLNVFSLNFDRVPAISSQNPLPLASSMNAEEVCIKTHDLSMPTCIIVTFRKELAASSA